jgi:hypothetical protein
VLGIVKRHAGDADHGERGEVKLVSGADVEWKLLVTPTKHGLTDAIPGRLAAIVIKRHFHVRIA